MGWVKKYWQLIAIGILLLIIFFGGYFFGQSLAQVRDMKREKNEYLQVKKEQDSIIKVNTKEKLILIDSIGKLEKSAIFENDKANSIKYVIIHDKQKSKEDIHSIPNLSVDSIKSRFNSEADSYKP